MKAKAEHMHYLDSLRASRVTNMVGAAPYLAYDYSIPIEDARKILAGWMNQDCSCPARERAALINKHLQE